MTAGLIPVRTRFFVVRNPKAGALNPRFCDAVLSRLDSAGCVVELIETGRHGEGREAAEAAARSGRFDAILAAGGDGTVHDVAEGVLGHPVPLGVIPAGTANVFAREIGLPRTADGLARLLLEGGTRRLPVGEVNGRPFLFVAGVGFDAEAVRLFEAGGTRRFGSAGFVWPVARALFSGSPSPLRVETDSGTTQAQWVIVTRTKHYAANLLLAPGADLRQPVFHVLCMRGSGPLTRIRQLSALLMGMLRHDPETRLERTLQVRIEGDPDVPVQIDGEMTGTLPLDIRPHDRQLALIAP